MAASMLKSSKHFSRCFSRISTFRQQIKPVRSSNAYTSIIECQTRCLSSFLSSSRVKALPTTSQAFREFHSTHLLLSDVQVVNTPPFADSITEGDVRWEKEVGDAVVEDDVVAEIETDKTSLPVHSPAAGIIEELLFGDGDTVQAGQPLFKLRLSGDAPPPKAAAPAAETKAPSPAAAAPPPTPVAPPTSSSGPIPSTPPPVPAVPTGPMRTTPTSSVPIKQYQPPSASSGASIAPALGDSVAAPARTEQRVKMNRMRQRIAQRLKDAQNTCAMLTTFNEIDMSNVMEMRKTYKDAFAKKHGIKLGFMSAFLKASSHALVDQPVVNAVIDEVEIVYRDYVDISVAVSTPKGLVVPVLRDVDKMNYADIELGLMDLGEKARTGQLAIEDMDGGTFTISNGGVFGSMFGTPIINPPQSAILGMHGIFERPVAINGKVEIRPMMYIALTYDHRLIDGREAVTFLKKIKSSVEDPRTILMDL